MTSGQPAASGRHSYRFGYNPGLHFPERATSAAEAKSLRPTSCSSERPTPIDCRTWTPCCRFQAAACSLRLELGPPAGALPSLRSRHRPVARYRLALGGAKIALGLLRSANRDRHTMRTFEIPACGAFLCAQRTDEHEELFREGTEAVFFNDPDELKSQITRYLDDEDARTRIAAAGFRAVTQGHHTYADRIVEMVALSGA